VSQQTWPERFRVTLRNREGGSWRYTVATWLGRDKAIALAASTHVRRHGDEATIYDVEVEDLGRAARDAKGLVALETGDLSDRAEF
jgi:hypothetical protein